MHAARRRPGLPGPGGPGLPGRHDDLLPAGDPGGAGRGGPAGPGGRARGRRRGHSSQLSSARGRGLRGLAHRGDRGRAQPAGARRPAARAVPHPPRARHHRLGEDPRASCGGGGLPGGGGPGGPERVLGGSVPSSSVAQPPGPEAAGGRCPHPAPRAARQDPGRGALLGRPGRLRHPLGHGLPPAECLGAGGSAVHRRDDGHTQGRVPDPREPALQRRDVLGLGVWHHERG